MSIIRAPRPEGNFYLLNKSISEDQRLSWASLTTGRCPPTI